MDGVEPDSSVSVDVIIVNYNGGEQLGQCLRALQRSGFPPTTVHVIDNNSSDNSLDCTSGMRGLSLDVVRNAGNPGFAVAANQGLRASGADYLLLLNPDCCIEPETIGETLSALKGRPDAGMAGALLLNADGTEQRGARRQLPRFGNALRRVLSGRKGAQRGFDLVGTPLPEAPVEVEAISGAFMLVRAEAAATVGLLDEGYFLHCEDLDWCARFGQAGWKILFVPGARAIHQQGVSSGTRPVRTLWAKHRGMSRYFLKFNQQIAAPLRWVVVAAIWTRALVLSVPVWLRWIRP